MRTYQGTIARIEDLEFDIKFRIKDNKPLYVKWKEDFGGAYVQKELIVNHSKELIDLVQIGDYVNGYKVIGVTLYPAPSGKYVDVDCDKPSYESYLFENEIKSILTKEMYEQNCYKVVK